LGEAMSLYSVIEVSLADTRRLFEYCQSSDLKIHLNLKGFDYGWILDSVPWKPSMRILDVGAGYSRLPIHIAERYGCEVWAVDDFGRLDEDVFWERNQDPQLHVERHPEIRYVIGRIGSDSTKDLPRNYFDIIYSASALEHVPNEDVPRVWNHLDQLLKINGRMLHGVDLAFPTSRGLKHVVLAMAYDTFYPIIPRSLQRQFMYETPKSFVRFISNQLHFVQKSVIHEIGVPKMVINPEVVTEPLEHTYNRILKDGQVNARHFRVTSLLLHLLKVK